MVGRDNIYALSNRRMSFYRSNFLEVQLHKSLYFVSYTTVIQLSCTRGPQLLINIFHLDTLYVHIHVNLVKTDVQFGACANYPRT